jgi:Ca2+/Na+ antiporter
MMMLMMMLMMLMMMMTMLVTSLTLLVFAFAFVFIVVVVVVVVVSLVKHHEPLDALLEQINDIAPHGQPVVVRLEHRHDLLEEARVAEARRLLGFDAARTLSFVSPSKQFFLSSFFPTLFSFAFPRLRSLLPAAHLHKNRAQ